MAICTGDSYVQLIEKTECIGNSLVKINYNFTELDKKLCETSSALDPVLVVPGIMKGDGNGGFSTALVNYDYYQPGTTLAWPLNVEGPIETNQSIIAAGTITSTTGGIVSPKLSITGLTQLGSNTTIAGTVTIGGAVTINSDVRINGGLTVTGNVVPNFTSDERLKNDITKIANALEKVNLLRGVEFNWNTELQNFHTGKDVGVIAQDVEKVLPTAVTERDTGYKAVNYINIIPLLIEAVKELKEQNAILKEEVDTLKGNKCCKIK